MRILLIFFEALVCILYTFTVNHYQMISGIY